MIHQIENWPRTRNGIRKRLKQAGVSRADLDDATQDACTFVVVALQQGIEPGLAIWRAVHRVLKRQTATWEPHDRDSWERSKRLPPVWGNAMERTTVHTDGRIERSSIRQGIVGVSQSARAAASGQHAIDYAEQERMADQAVAVFRVFAE